MLSFEDLAEWHATVEEPATLTYRGLEVHRCPPWTQGPVFLQQLAILEGYDLTALGHNSAEYLHVLIESAKLAFADREAYYGDPLFDKIALDVLLSKEYAAKRQGFIGREASREFRPGDVGRGVPGYATFDVAADPPRRAAWYYWTGFLHSVAASRPEVPIAYCREAAAIADAHGLDEIKALAECGLTHVYGMAGELRAALEAGERGLAMFEARGNVWWACRTLWGLSIAAIYAGEWERSLEYCRRALEHGEAVNDLRLKVVGLWRTEWTHIQRGDTQARLRCCEEALALSPSPFDAAMTKAARGYGMVKAGEIAAGMALLAESVAWFDRSHLRLTRSAFALFLGDGYLRQGKPAEARAVFEEILATSREVGYRHLEGIAQRLLGKVFAPEDPAAAAHHLGAALQILEEVGARNEIAKTLAAQAELRRAAGNITRARQLLERALVILEELGTLDEPPRLRAALAALAPDGGS